MINEKLQHKRAIDQAREDLFFAESHVPYSLVVDESSCLDSLCVNK
jgi:hypothetical protein